MILCLDLGTKTGWAIRVGDERVASGMKSFVQKPGANPGLRYLQFLLWLQANFTTVEAVYYEEVRRHLGTDAAHAYGGYRAVLQLFCCENDIPCEGIGVGTIKKTASGKGNATKQVMLRAASAHFGKAVKDDNEADALCLLYTVEYLESRDG